MIAAIQPTAACDPSILDRDADRVIHAVQENRPVCKEFVNGFSGAVPVTVIVNDQNTTGRKKWIENLKLAPSGFVPVRVEAQDCNLLR